MSTSVTHPGAANPGGSLGLAAAGLALVIAIGITFAVGGANDATVPTAGPAHPMVSDAHRAKAEILAERAASSPGANVEQYKVGAGIIGVEPTPVFNVEGYRVEREQATRANDAWSRRYQEYYEFLIERSQSTGTGAVAGE
jgi:hypothetical protein